MRQRMPRPLWRNKGEVLVDRHLRRGGCSAESAPWRRCRAPHPHGNGAHRPRNGRPKPGAKGNAAAHHDRRHDTEPAAAWNNGSRNRSTGLPVSKGDDMPVAREHALQRPDRPGHEADGKWVPGHHAHLRVAIVGRGHPIRHAEVAGAMPARTPQECSRIKRWKKSNHRRGHVR
jgi:hypothetical protein